MNEEIWRAIVECDPAYDGQLYYGLVTTGVFCRPSCRSKTPKRENVRIFHTPSEARKAGLRPCKRCRPEEQEWRSHEEELARQLARLIDGHYAEPLSLQSMAARLFVSPYYLLRCFRRVMNTTPARYLQLTRLEHAKALLRDTGESITAVALQTGFASSAHFSAVFHKEVGCPPSAYRQLADRDSRKGAGPS
ncbi:methylphosphotriester-DNA--protein-cysteine methyltransferase family protein [Brevibacillus sp. SYP-B805]|uniref:bifunctional transcriptional activator/DNA repair enzyme AdaA n=1 Tax=Brevibacillus sp. SYP-B805 TaxID=1578199 RepID=UPI0013EC33F8|nr:Ada metal-binding domain-containing protein [Brevibacillus sp. SYP-B805]NGQ96782.1 methylphosphotriester-DNA--protein-cysteine methyltransferase family protein [Brevibacillus sp. SYP-B805]